MEECACHGKSAPGVRFVGRVEPTGRRSGRYAWSGAGFVLRFDGTGVTFTLDDANWHTLILDGEELSPLVTTRAESRYEVVHGLAAGPHTLEVYRRTEALFGPTTLRKVQITAGKLLEPPPAPSRRIELVGDSISCGYGNLGARPECSFTPETEDHYRSYGAIAARALGAELSTVAWSGRGVVKNYGGEAAPLMPELYLRALPEEDAAWRFPHPNSAVVINLGTNDFSTAPDPKREIFRDGYASLIAQIRAKNPSAFILATIGPMLGRDDLKRCLDAINSAVESVRLAGDQRIAVHTFQTPNENPGCDWHPGLATHEKLASELATLLAPHVRTPNG